MPLAAGTMVTGLLPVQQGVQPETQTRLAAVTLITGESKSATMVSGSAPSEARSAPTPPEKSTVLLCTWRLSMAVSTPESRRRSGTVKVEVAELPASSVAFTVKTAAPAGSRALAARVVSTALPSVMGPTPRSPSGKAFWRSSRRPWSSSEAVLTCSSALGVPASVKSCVGSSTRSLGAAV